MSGESSAFFKMIPVLIYMYELKMDTFDVKTIGSNAT
jgi:hypothetical protein